MQWLKASSLTVYVPMPADPNQLAEKLTSCRRVHTAILKGEECDGRPAHTELEKVLCLVKWCIFLWCCGALCFASISCGFSDVPPFSLWQAGFLVVPACGLMPQSISLLAPHLRWPELVVPQGCTAGFMTCYPVSTLWGITKILLCLDPLKTA